MSAETKLLGLAMPEMTAGKRQTRQGRKNWDINYVTLIKHV